MQIVIPIAMIIVFFGVLILINKKNLGVSSFSEYATANRTVGVLGVTMAIFSTWYVGAMFTAWAGFSVGFGMIAFYVVPYALMSVFTMYLCGPRTFLWAKKYSLETQGDLMGFRYKSPTVQFIVGLLGVVWTAPWLLMEWVTQGYIFEYASQGYISPFWGMLMGVVVVLVYVSLGGMKSVITANIFQGIFMFVVGNGIMLYIVYSMFGGFESGFNQILEQYPAMLTYPGPGWDPGTNYWTSIVLTSCFGTFMWPWIYNKLFAADSIRSIKKSAIGAPILGMIFWAIFVYAGNFLHLLELPRSNPQEAFIWASAKMGVWPLALMSTMIMAASVATVAGIVQAMSTSFSKDMAKVIKKDITDATAVKLARYSVAGICAIALVFANIDVGLLIFVALLTYQGIVMIFPALVLGLFWRRANKEGALASLIGGTIISMGLTFINPPFIAQWGWTPGMYGLAAAFLIMWIFGYLRPEEPQVTQMWQDIEDAKSATLKRLGKVRA